MPPNPKYERYAARLRELIAEGHRVARLEKPSPYPGLAPFIQTEDRMALNAWLVNLENILQTVFGPDSAHFRHFTKLTARGLLSVEHSDEIYPLIGILNGALNDLEGGYLIDQEFIVAGEVFDSLLEQARYLNQNGYKDAAAVLMRVIIEDALKRIARYEGIDDNQKASQINDEFKKKGRYPQPQWRLIQQWLDIGNSAAHGKFEDYTAEDITVAIAGVERFLASDFRN